MGTDRRALDLASLRERAKLVADRYRTPTPDPAPGQVWKARWAECVQTVLVVDVADVEFEAIPLSSDETLDGVGTVVLHAGEQPLEYDVVAWRSLRCRLPERVLGDFFGSVMPAVLDRVESATPEGPRITSVIDERSQVSDAIDDRMHELASCSWLPLVFRTINVGELAAARDIQPSKVAEALQVNPGAARAILVGDLAPSPDQYERLASLLGVAVDEIAAAPPIDPDLAMELDRPVYRERLWEVGREAGARDEVEARLGAARAVLALAARTPSGVQPRQVWASKIEDYLNGR